MWREVKVGALGLSLRYGLANELVASARLADGGAFAGLVEVRPLIPNRYLLHVSASAHHRALAHLHDKDLASAWAALLAQERPPFVRSARRLAPGARTSGAQVKAALLVLGHATIKREGLAAPPPRHLTAPQRAQLAALAALDGGALAGGGSSLPALARRGLARRVEAGWVITLKGVIAHREGEAA